MVNTLFMVSTLESEATRLLANAGFKVDAVHTILPESVDGNMRLIVQVGERVGWADIQTGLFATVEDVFGRVLHPAVAKIIQELEDLKL